MLLSSFLFMLPPVPELVEADSTFDLYDYIDSAVCSGAPIKTLKGEATDSACRTECDALFGCLAFSVEPKLCMLFSDCASTEPNELYLSGVLVE